MQLLLSRIATTTATRPITRLVPSRVIIRTRNVSYKHSFTQRKARPSFPVPLHHHQHLQQQQNSPYSTGMASPSDTAATQVQQSTGITPDTLTSTLREKLNTLHIDIQDISGGCGQSFAALIVSDDFQGKGALARHRLVNGALKDEIAAIHAWTPRCLTGEQWEKEKEKMKGA